MPVAKRGERGGRQAAFVAFAATMGMLAIFFLISKNADLIGGSGSGEISLGAGGVFTAPAEPIAETIADSGPTILPDVASRDRDIILQHLGDDPLTGWYAFAARPLDASRDCTVTWVPDEAIADGGDFFHECSGTRFPADGTGLTQYPVVVDPSGTVSVDLNAAERTAATEEEPTSDTSEG